ncbi:guanine nucleotide-binding protein subunit beta-like protein 1 [Littorina saxatilis]
MAGVVPNKSIKTDGSKEPLPPPSPTYILRGAESPVTALEYTEPALGTLLSGCQNGTIHLWDLNSRRNEETFDAHNGKPVLYLKSEDASRLLMSHGRDGYFKFWKNVGPEFELDGKIEAEGDGFCPPVPLKQKKLTRLIALPGSDSVVNIFELNSRSLVRTLSSGASSGELGLCMCMCAIPNLAGNDESLLVGYESGKMILWDIGTGKIQHQAPVHADAVMCMAYSSPEFNKGLSGSVDEMLVAWSITEDGEIQTVNKLESTNAGFNDVKIRPDDRIAVTAGWDNNIRVFNMKSLRPLAILAYHRDSVHCVEFSENYMLAAGSKDHLISVWDIYRQV